MKNITVKEAADLVGGKIIGSEENELKNIAKLEEARQGELSFLYLPSYEKYLATTKASAVLIKPKTKKTNSKTTYIEVENPNLALQKIVVEFFKPELKVSGIDKSASVNYSSKIGKNVTIGKNVVISEGCEIGDNSVILHNSVLMEKVKVGNNSLIYPNVTVREECEIGNNVIIHSGTVIGSDGFGYTPDSKGVYTKVPQIGNVVIKDDAEIGSNVSIDRAAMGSTLIKKGAKIDNLVQIAHNVVIGEHTVISAQTGISGSAKVGAHCILAGQVGLVGHIEITDGVIIGAQSGVSKSIKKPGKYFGFPAKELGTTLRLESHIRNLPNYAEKIKNLEEKISKLELQLENNSEKEK